MKQHISNFLSYPSRFLNQRVLVLIAFIILLPCLLFLLAGWAPRRSQAIHAKETTTTPVSTLSTITPTKWWIKETVTISAIPRNIDNAVSPTDESALNCQSSYSVPLQSGIFAYITLNPPLPNRIRAGAGKANAYLGQIQPGSGLEILDGPVCADGFAWWLVKSTETLTRGWTVMGSGSQQWILPCPNPKIACEKTLATPQVFSPADHTVKEERNQDKCSSIMLSVGVVAQVAQDDLLAIRSEPYTGSVIGHAGPMSEVKIVDGPTCVGNAVWWKVNLDTLGLTGWVTEANLEPCGKESDCS